MISPKPHLPIKYVEEIAEQGFTVIPCSVDADEVQRLLLEIDVAARITDDTSIRRRESMFAIRNLTTVAPGIFNGQLKTNLCKFVKPVLGGTACLVRAILFDKTADSNWGVFWHQDLSIAAKQQEQVAGF